MVSINHAQRILNVTEDSFYDGGRYLSEDAVRRIVEDSGADAVIHTAAISDISVCEKRPEDSFQANVNLHKHTLFIVDEASMIANEGLAGSMFGSGRLLDDLIHFVYS